MNENKADGHWRRQMQQRETVADSVIGESGKRPANGSEFVVKLR